MSGDRNQKVTEWIDVAAPRELVFDLVLNLERRMQLSPLWGIAEISGLSADYPNPGSHYHVRVVKGEQIEYDTQITELQPLRKLSYRLLVERNSHITWNIQDSASGTRILYEETFNVKDEDADLAESVREVIKNWLQNIKRYLELPQSRTGRVVRWFMDRYYLKLRQDQRRAVQAILFMQAIGFISFVMAAIALGIAGIL